FSGNSVICLVETSAPMLALSVCSNAAVAFTSTCSEAPMVSATIWLADCPTSSTIPSCLKDLKPAAETDKLYVPAGKRANEKFPSASVLKARVTPFSGLLNTTLAFARRAPEESETEPENDAVEAKVCPCAMGRAVLIAKAATAKRRSGVRLRSFGI